MTVAQIQLGELDTDDSVDEEISACLNPSNPKSFFLFAGAGSGKTRSLKNALEKFKHTHGESFRRCGKKVAVITYTNAAAFEISQRVGADTLFPISTIHSFCWGRIHTFHADIQAWLLATLPIELAEIEEKQRRGRGGQASIDRQRSMELIAKRIERLSVPRRFVYNPNGNNFEADSLSHAEVIQITATFIREKSAMQASLANEFPFLLIDESQDTNKHLLDALFELAAKSVGLFALGLFGDTMQRIYLDGKPNLGVSIPDGWSVPSKKMNHRSSQRVVALANALRLSVDGREQFARSDSEVGFVRVFIGSDAHPNRLDFESSVRKQMAALCSDELWNDVDQIKTLTLEHHMAATRRGFIKMFQALDKDPKLSTGLRNGELAGLRFFTECVMPLEVAYKAGDKFSVLNLLRTLDSPLLQKKFLIQTVTPDDPLKDARDAVDALMQLLDADKEVSFGAVLKCVAHHQLFKVPLSLIPFTYSDEENALEEVVTSNGDVLVHEQVVPTQSGTDAWREFLDSPYSQIKAYAEYISDKGPYGTHQGVKGLEFDRVLVVMDDSGSKGFLFSYEKLLGAKPPSDGDLKKIADGEETGLDRTKRLLYVTCTRAKKSLALVVYTSEPKNLSDYVIEQQWFQEDEVVVIK